MNDRELLELAAKAAGVNLRPMQTKNVTGPGDDRFIGYLTDPAQWESGWFSPLTDDADALRLAVKLKIHISGFFDKVTTDTDDRSFCENYGSDEFAATRRAIVRAAAEIGKAMK